jgi:hypothetical protein
LEGGVPEAAGHDGHPRAGSARAALAGGPDDYLRPIVFDPKDPRWDKSHRHGRLAIPVRRKVGSSWCGRGDALLRTHLFPHGSSGTRPRFPVGRGFDEASRGGSDPGTGGDRRGCGGSSNVQDYCRRGVEKICGRLFACDAQAAGQQFGSQSGCENQLGGQCSPPSAPGEEPSTSPPRTSASPPTRARAARTCQQGIYPVSAARCASDHRTGARNGVQRAGPELATEPGGGSAARMSAERLCLRVAGSCAPARIATTPERRFAPSDDDFARVSAR